MFRRWVETVHRIVRVQAAAGMIRRLVATVRRVVLDPVVTVLRVFRR